MVVLVLKYKRKATFFLSCYLIFIWAIEVRPLDFQRELPRITLNCRKQTCILLIETITCIVNNKQLK